MSSMLDRLRAAQPISKKARADQPGEKPMLVRQTRAEIETDLSEISSQTLAYLGLQTDDSIDLRDFLFLDTETTGLRGGAGTIAFLIGLGQFQDKQFALTQYMIRDYHQEPAMLRQVFERFKQARCLVTFNGASFDMPLLESRATVNRLQDICQIPLHLDMIHAARRVFKLRIRQCSLTGIEQQVFGESRADDLPGAEIPARFFRYLKTGEEGLMQDVLEHNALDILSLARLTALVAQLHESPLASAHQKDMFSIGKVYEKHGQVEKAATCFRACTDRDVRVMAGVRLADMLKRHRNNLEAADAYETLLSSQAASAHVYTALAKIYEHRLKDPARALAIVNQGMIYCAERSFLSEKAAEDYAALEHRSLRLKRKVEKQRHGFYVQDQSSFRPVETPEGPGGGSEEDV